MAFIEEDHPYYAYKVKLPDNEIGFYCEDCKRWHYKRDSPQYEYFYNVCVAYVCMMGCRSCNQEYAEKIVKNFNDRHVFIRDLSIAQGYKPVFI
jgi:hypothetical protein